MKGLLNRLKEPSTWAGIAALFGVFGIQLAPEKLTAIVAVGTAVAGLVAVFLPEGKSS